MPCFRDGSSLAWTGACTLADADCFARASVCTIDDDAGNAASDAVAGDGDGVAGGGDESLELSAVGVGSAGAIAGGFAEAVGAEAAQLAAAAVVPSPHCCACG